MRRAFMPRSSGFYVCVCVPCICDSKSTALLSTCVVFKYAFINTSVVVVVWYDCSSVRHYLQYQHLSSSYELPQGHGRSVLRGDPLQRGQSLLLVPRQDVVAGALREPLFTRTER